MHRAAALALALVLACPAGSVVAAGAGAIPPGSTPDSGAVRGRPESLDATGRWIVLLRDGTTMAAAGDRAGRLGIVRDRTFRSAVRGYSARLDGSQLASLRSDPGVAAVVPDGIVSLTGQTIPRGVRRIFAPLNPIAGINGSDERVNADVAIVDTGIDGTHPDLNVVGGYNCSTPNPAAWGDANGHGTHVAGTVGALDNGIGVVGVAPGVRLWSVRILNSAGDGLVSWYLCGLDWIAAQRDPVDPTLPLFEAVNMSVAKTGTDDHNCGLTNRDLMHQAVCRLVASGVTVVAAAGNNSFNAARLIPASYDEVITVSALADTDGLPGGLGGNACYSWSSWDRDDTFADFSNYGSDVDLIAPGKCIWSTRPGNTYGYSSGTSMATPHVTGAVALYKASRPLATPAEVKAALLAAGTQDWNTATDPDGVHEPLLNVARIVALGDWTVDAGRMAGRLSAAGATVQVPVYVVRAEDVLDEVALSVDAPPGIEASLSTPTVAPDASQAALTIVVGRGLATGTYRLTVHGAVGDVTRSATVDVVVDGDLPTMTVPRLGPVAGTRFDTTSFTGATFWSAATDPTSPIAGYQLSVTAGSGPAGAPIATRPDARTVSRTFRVGTAYAVSARVADAAGNWSDWSAPPPFRARVVQDSSRSVVRRGTWTRYFSLGMSGGTTRAAKDRGASVGLTFTGRAIAVVMPCGPTRGKARIMVDGLLAATVNTYHSTPLPRRVAFAKTWSGSGPHTVSVVVVGTGSHPRVDVDAFLVIE